MLVDVLGVVVGHTMLPAPAARRCGSAASITATVPSTSTSKLRRQPSMLGGMPPLALVVVTTTSRPPSRAAESSTHAVTAAGSSTSTAVPITPLPISVGRLCHAVRVARAEGNLHPFGQQSLDDESADAA